MSEILLGRWDCDACGTKGVLGDKYECHGCGSSRPEFVEFYLPDDASVVTNHADIAAAKAGPDWKCEFCDSWIPATLEACNRCSGGAAQNSQQQAVTAYASDKQIPRTSEEAAQLTGQRYEQSILGQFREPSRPAINEDVEAKTSQPKIHKKFPALPASLLAGGVFLFIFLIIFLFQSKDVSVEVTGHQWKRVQNIQQYQALTQDGWDHPTDAYNIRTSRRIHHHERVLDHYEQRFRTETYREQDGYSTETYTERVVAGTERYISSYSTKNLGNGRFERTPNYSTRTIYRNETRSRQVPRYVTKTRQVPYQEAIYRQEPVYRTHYAYSVNRWVDVTPRILEGSGTNAQWPSQDLQTTGNQLGRLRAGSRSETYTITVITLDDSRTTYRVNLNYDQWINFRDGQRLIARMRLGHIEQLLLPDVR